MQRQRGFNNLLASALKALHGCRGALLLQLLDAYAVRYSEMLEGRSEALPVSELAGGARIRHIFQDIFYQGLSALNPSKCGIPATRLAAICMYF